ncbi:hypothetical protein BGZ98_007560 [Dissophora globulifera]|nr:hypothetical protein BGZ98_007560 [Dissophora globulifera]
MEEANLGSSNVVRYSKEPLPWEVLGEEEDDVYGDPEWSHSPWGGKFRYENDQEDSDADTGRDHDHPCEGTVIADKDRHSQSQYRSQRAHREQEGFSAFKVDMDDESDISDDQGLTRTESADSAGRQDDVETTKEGSPDSNTKDFDMMQVDSHVDQETDKGHPQMDEVDLLGYEAEVDWLNEQDEIKHAQRKQQHHHHHSGRFEGEVPNAEFGAEDDDEEDTEGQGDEESDIESGESEEADDEALGDEAVEGAEGAEEEEYTPGMSPEEVYNDIEWHAKHGGLNPKHFHLSNHKAAVHKKSVTRAEKNDRDEDGIVFPELHSNQPYSKLVYPITRNDPDSSLGYVAYNRQGDRIMDFSMVGWNEGNTDLPDPTKDVPVMERLSPRAGADSNMDKGDDTERIQNALDRVSKTTKTMVRRNDVVPKGALVLERGVYRISKPLKIYSSGILFRGDPKGGSRIVFQWEPTGPRYAIEVEGDTDEMLEDTRVPIISDYTPVGSPWLALDPTYIQEAGLTVGDQIVVTRIGNERWVKDIGMDDFNSDKKGVKPWKKMSGRMYRSIRSLNLQTGVIQLDAPIPVSISRRYGGGFVTKYRDGKIRALGIQFLDMVFPNNIGRTKNDMLDEEGRGSKDYRFSYEIFANYALRVDCACHMYISHITSAFFHNFVSLGSDVHHITMDSVVHSYPDEMLSGQSAFQLSGQLVLIKNSLSQGSFHFFVDINHVMGPNVFHRSMGTNVGKTQQPIPLDFAPGEVGPHMKFCTGILVDQVVTDGSIQIVNRGDMGTGQGYAGANSVVWNSRAREGILTHRARGFQNFVIGSETLEAEDRQPWDSHGWKEHLGSEVLPGSLYLRQLSDRLDRLAKGWVA